ncbi:MAG: threonine--tRNA ligase [Candidatus Aureabacteria bacterium]|nr:threonine--tRNA ligase [Candidatus Auribacterota bacterium]
MEQEHLETCRHSASHVMAQAVKRLFPSARLGIGPAIEDGFYYDFDLPEPLVPEALAGIEAEMRKIIAADYHFERQEISEKEAEDLFRTLNEDYKLELLRELQGQPISIYRDGEFVDLCRGPHLKRTGEIKAFKLLSTAGAYWRGDERRPMLQRIYGTAFPDKKSLDEYLRLRAEAEKRDHRRLGAALDLFHLDPEAGPGLVLWHPKGALVRKIIEDFWREEHLKAGYEFVATPHIARRQLWDKSGHTDFFAANMYAPMNVDQEQYLVKPMNCPFHLLIYKNRLRSYRELPIRWAELGTVYRYEKSGVLHGLIRVRGFTQDDAHLIFREEQMEEEVERVISFCVRFLQQMGFSAYGVYLSTRPKEYIGTEEVWGRATDALRHGLEKTGLAYRVDEGAGTFYGPKIDIKITDALKRDWQCSTIQLDFNEPERFDLSYVGEDGRPHRPVMIHRALLGSIERFFGVLIEHYGGAFPLWLSPVQVRVLPISEKFLAYARAVESKLSAAGLRAETDPRNEKIGWKVRVAQTEKIPYMLIVGEQEEQTGTVSLRARGKGDLGKRTLEECVAAWKDEIARKISFPGAGDSIQ